MIATQPRPPRRGCLRLQRSHPERSSQRAGFPLDTERAADGNRGVWRVTETFKRALLLKLTRSELAALLMSRPLLSPPGVGVLGPEVASA